MPLFSFYSARTRTVARLFIRSAPLTGRSRWKTHSISNHLKGEIFRAVSEEDR
jgi:hypothetical protein